MRKIAESDLAELKKIFDVTGGSQLYEIIEEKSREVIKKKGKTKNLILMRYTKHLLSNYI